MIRQHILQFHRYLFCNIPFHKKGQSPPLLSFRAFLLSVLGAGTLRCTKRGFNDTAIPEEDLQKVLSVSRLAPSACNRQPQRIIVVREPENLSKVQKAYKIFGAPCVLIVCRDRRNELVRPFDNKCSGDLDIGIVCDHIMLAARELGIGSVMVGLFDPAIIRKEFDLPEYIEPTALLILGYPTNGFLSPDRHQSERKPLCDTVMFERYSEK